MLFLAVFCGFLAENVDTNDSKLEEDPLNNGPGTPFPESSTPMEPGTLPHKQEVKNMETHAHHLHHAPGKKIWHYFYEFLMLFLAVFCGFLAENLREHHVERLRAREYAKSLVEDVAKDTVEIHDVIREDKIILTCFDSISSIIQTGIKDKRVRGSFYYYSTIGTAVSTVVWNNATLTQITQSGNLRYFENLELVNKISRYYSISEYISALNNNDKRYRERSMELRNKVLSNTVFTRYSRFNLSGWLGVPDSVMNSSVYINSDNAELMNEFANSFETRRSPLLLSVNTAYLIELTIARELIALLKKEYDLNN
jgi:hypothetical protein